MLLGDDGFEPTSWAWSGWAQLPDDFMSVVAHFQDFATLNLGWVGYSKVFGSIWESCQARPVRQPIDKTRPAKQNQAS